VSTYKWSTREEWEAEQRSRAECCISDGINAWDYGESQLGYTDDERAEVKSLAPEAIKAIRRACGRVERELRKQYPHAAELAKGFYWWCDQHGYPKRPKDGRAVAQFEEAYHGYHAEIESLTTAEDAALDTFGHLRDIRKDLKERGWWYRPFEAGWKIRHLDTLSLDSPELDRLQEISDQAVTQSQEHWRARGRTVLADLESGKAWEDETQRRIELDEWFAKGPLIEVIGS
jgi:hypothetical protein